MSIQRAQLDNGIRVLTKNADGARSVSIGVMVNAGPQLDPPDKFGLAHFVEHALFQGTRGRDALALSRMIDQAGGQMGAFTTRDYTCLFANVLGDYVTYALDLLGDIVAQSTFPEQQLAREREAIAREIESARDAPLDYLHERLKLRMWAEHPLGRPIAGDLDSVRGLTRNDVVDFVGRYYTGDRLLIAAAGAVEDDFVDHARDAFWGVGRQSEPDSPKNCDYTPAIFGEERPLSLSYFVVAIPTAPYATVNRYALHVLNCLLGSGLSSRLFRCLREENSAVHHVQSDVHAYRDAGALVIEGGATPQQLLSTLRDVLGAVGRLASGADRVGDEEVWKAKTQIRGQLQLASENMHIRMSRLATQEFYFGRPFSEGEVLDEIENVDAEDVQRVAYEVLWPALSKASIGWVGPALPVASPRQAVVEMRQQICRGPAPACEPALVQE